MAERVLTWRLVPYTAIYMVNTATLHLLAVSKQAECEIYVLYSGRCAAKAVLESTLLVGVQQGR